MAISRPNRTGADGGSGGPLAGGDAATLFPTLWEWLSCEQFDDGSARVTATVLVFVEGGMCKLCFNDRDGHRKAWITGKSPSEAFQALEASLAADRLEWRPDQGKPGLRKK